MDTKNTETKHQDDDRPLIPGVDYDVLSEEELAAELAQPDPLVEENDAHVLALVGELPEYHPEDHSEISPEENAEISRRLVAKLLRARTIGDLE